MRLRTSVALCLAAVLMASAAQAAAGFSLSSSSAAGDDLKFAPEKIVGFAKKVERALAAKGARVALLARIGSPPEDLPEGFHYTHVAFAVYSQITTADGRSLPGYAIYNLYQVPDKLDTSTLVQDYPADFFAGVAVLEAVIVIPSAELQARLLQTIASPTYAALHEPRYSLIANPFTLGRQNCTEFVLDVLNAAIYQTDDINKIKASEKAYFHAQPVNVNPLKTLLGSIFMDEISVSDHPDSPRTATFEKLAEYLLKYDAGAEVLNVYAD
jgi:hypothetical protein